MKFTKKRTTTVSLILGGVLFVSAAVVGIASSNGYGLYKEALKKMLTVTNYTMDIDASYTIDGEKIDNIALSERVDIGGDVELNHTETINDNKVADNYFQDGYAIYSSRYDANVLSYTVYDNVTNNTPSTAFGTILGTNYQTDETAEKVIKFAELAADLVVGDLKNNFIYEGTDDGISTYSITLDTFQIPEIIRAGVDLITTSNSSYSDVDELKEAAKRSRWAYFYKDVVISNVSCVVKVNADGYLSENNIKIVINGNDWDDVSHEAVITLNVNSYDFGTTEPERLDIENTPNVTIMSKQNAKRIDEINAILKSEDLSDTAKNAYELELKSLQEDSSPYSSKTVRVEAAETIEE